MRIFGYDPTELIGKPLTVLMPEWMRKLHDGGFRRYLATGQRHINWQGTELTGLRKNGEEFPVEVSFGELTRDGHKVFTGFIRDISARKSAEERLRASERSLRELTETIPQMLWSAEPDGAVDYCNQRALDYTGLSAEQVRGAGWIKTVHRDDIESMSRAWTTAVSSGEPFQQEFRSLRAADQTYRWCISRALPLRDPNGRILKWFGTVVDLHDWREAQQALRMTQAELARVSRLTTMGELAASIAHEVNQPLTAVTNNGSACLRLLANRSLEPEVLRRALEEIVADGTRASAVIARIRGFIKKAPVEKTVLDVNEVIQEVLALAGHELHRNPVLVECQLANTLPLVRADRIQLQQVLLNLIMNSIEAMTGAANQSRVLAVESRVDESGDVLVAVRDSGPGPGSEADRLFTPFFTTKANGMGMGLPISRSLIESHGGRLWATTNSPHGAVFSFTLPAAGESPS
jgi:PAS domain S-box-containing protein